MRQEKRKNLTNELQKLRKALKLKCQEDCMCGQKKIDCEIDDCSLYPYRPFLQNKDQRRIR